MLPAQRIREHAQLARYADGRGVHAIWVPEERLATDAITAVAVYATVTEQARIGVGVLPLWTRHPALIAQTFATLDLLAPGRALLGLGAWWEPLASSVGVDRGNKMVLAMREYIESIRSLLTLRRVTYEGQYVRLDDVQLDHGGTRPHEVPIYIGAVGPQMLRLTGRIADGALFTGMQTAEVTKRAIAEIKKGAAAAGRSLDDIALTQTIRIKLTDDRERAIQADKPMLAQLIAQQAHIAYAADVDPPLRDKLRSMLSWPPSREEILAAAELIPDHLVEASGCYGGENEVRERLRQCDALGLIPSVWQPSSDLIDLLAEGW